MHGTDVGRPGKFLSNFTHVYVGSVLLVDFLSTDLQDKIFSLGRQGEVCGFSLGSVHH